MYGSRCTSYFFFFQAEDGIRDKLVTGVQTCALPICRRGLGHGPLKRAERLVEAPAHPLLQLIQQIQHGIPLCDAYHIVLFFLAASQFAGVPGLTAYFGVPHLSSLTDVFILSLTKLVKQRYVSAAENDQ